MAYVERSNEELTAALEVALGKAFAPDEIAVRCSCDTGCGKSQYTYRELLEAFKNKNEFGLKLMESIRTCAKKSDRDPMDWIGHYSK